MPNILLIADDSWVTNDLAAAVSDPTTTITVCNDPRQAVGLARDGDFDLFVADMQVGSMGGLAVLRAFTDATELGELDPLPSILLLDRPADRFLAERTGANAFLVKPFTAQELRLAIRSLAVNH